MTVCVGGGELIAQAVARYRPVRRLIDLEITCAQPGSAETAAALTRKIGRRRSAAAKASAFFESPDLLLAEVREWKAAAESYGLSDDYRRLLERKDARAEILGYFLDGEGHPLLRIRDSAGDLQVLPRSAEVIWFGEGAGGARAFWCARRYLSPKPGCLLADSAFIKALRQVCA